MPGPNHPPAPAQKASFIGYAMHRLLDVVYRSAAVLACLFLIAIALITLANIAARPLGIALYSTDEFAGWAMAASTFLGLSATLRQNEHIRVALLIERLAPNHRKLTEFVCLVISTLFMGLFAWYAGTAVYESFVFGEMTQGMVPVPLWIPQSGMAVGALLMFVALAEELTRSLRGEQPSYLTAAPASTTESI